MKKKLLTLLGVCALGSSIAQNVNIPDPQFKTFLLSASTINTNGDAEIQVSEAAAYTGTISSNSGTFTDLTGIEAFTNLTTLWLSNHNLSSLDVSQCQGLVTLSVWNNQLTSVTVGTNNNLENFWCGNNQLTSLDISQLPNLKDFGAENNLLTTINFTQNPLLEYIYIPGNQLNALDVTQNPLLNELSCANNNLSSIDVSQQTTMSSFDCSYNQLVGLEIPNNSILAPMEINCSNNMITTLDLSNFNSYFYLYCDTNNLVSLDVANGFNSSSYMSATANPNLSCISVDDPSWSNTNWTDIDPASNYMTSCPCDVFIPDANFKAALVGNTAINTNSDTEIQCSEAAAYVGAIAVPGSNINNLTGIEAFLNITQLYAEYNNISSVDLSNNQHLTLVDIRDNNLSSITLGSTNLESLTVFQNNLSSIDVSGLNSLSVLSADENQLTNLDVSNNPTLTSLSVSDNQLTSIDLSQNTQLTDLSIGQNSLTTIDLSNNAALVGLTINGNPIPSIDLSNNLNLGEFYCENTALTSLDLSQNSDLAYFSPSNNSQLSSLNIANGNNQLITGFGFYAINIPNLTCIQVDDAAWSTTNWTNIDAQMTFSENCSSVSLNEVTGVSVSLYPNPSSGIIYVNSNSVIQKVIVYNQLGRIVAHFHGSELDLESLSPGIYLVEIHTHHGKAQKRIQKL